MDSSAPGDPRGLRGRSRLCAPNPTPVDRWLQRRAE